MKRLATFRERLGWKLFVSYMVIVFVGVVVSVVTAELQAPTILARDFADLQVWLRDNPSLAAALKEDFSTAVNEFLLIGTLAGVLAAIVLSLFTARRIVSPIQDMRRATQRIAAGNYHQRVQVPSQDELGALAQAFNQMTQTLERTEQRRLELIGNVAHELRTPLSNIRSSMEGLIDGVLPAEPSTFLEIQHEVARLRRLVQDLEELSRAEAGQISLDLRPVVPADLVQTVAERLRIQFDDKAVSLRIDVPGDLPRAPADTGRITQVLLNLLGNALQYTPPGGQVTVRVWCERHEIVFAVQDTGIGISVEQLPHIFERFYRVEKSRSRAGGGSGIGLTIAKHLVEAHGGRIWATSRGFGQGSTFSFTLPLSS